MQAERQSSRYQEMEVLSASRERLIPLLYEHLLVNLKRGGLHIRRGDIEGKYASLARAKDIVFELVGSLDMEAGGDLARRLGSLYAFWVREITASDREMNADRLDRVVEMVTSLHESWVEAVDRVEAERGGSAAGAVT